MPFPDRYDSFCYSYVQKNPDLIKSHVDLYYKDHQGKVWFCPEGFVCDGESIPRSLWTIVGHPMEATAIRAAFLHDYNYFTGKRPKKEVDKMFYDALVDDENPHPYVRYLGVKLFGFKAWNKYRRG